MVCDDLQGGKWQERVICGYNPCYNKKPKSSTTYQQHRRYFATSQTKFKEDLVSQLQQWSKEGDRLIVCLDANKDIYKKSLGKSLTDIDGLTMKEVVGEFTHTPVGTTFFRGLKPIDGVWAAADITVCNASIMPAGYGIKDHRLFVIDFASSNVIGKMAPKVVRAASQQLNTKIPRAAAEYARILKEKIIQCRLIERVSKAHTKFRYKCSTLTW